jgi:hypothetical protein
MKTVKGSFQVKSSPLENDSTTQEIGAMRMKFDKSFEGSLSAKSIVSMMGIMDRSTGSGAYVAIEKIEGELENKKGSFCMAHSSSMNQGVPQQSITVIPGTGTDELKNISGTMIIDIIDGNHFYTFQYQI